MERDVSEYPKSLNVDGGQELIMRPVEETDEQALIRFFRELSEKDRRFLKDDVTDEAVIKRWMVGLDFDRVFPLLALHNGEVVGDATLHRNRYGWSRHVGEVRAVVSKEWPRRGVAQALIRELVSHAVDAGLELLEAHVLEGQHSAQKALEAIGFRATTVLSNRAKDQTGRLRNVVIMTNDVSELWRRMEDLIDDGGRRSGHY